MGIASVDLAEYFAGILRHTRVLYIMLLHIMLKRLFMCAKDRMFSG